MSLRVGLANHPLGHEQIMDKIWLLLESDLCVPVEWIPAKDWQNNSTENDLQILAKTTSIGP